MWYHLKRIFTAAKNLRQAKCLIALNGMNSRKATLNFRKHGVSFDEASTVFDDPLAAIFDDETHSTAEVRELMIGHAMTGRLLLVSFTERPENMLRLISARVATKKERQDYEDNLNS